MKNLNAIYHNCSSILIGSSRKDVSVVEKSSAFEARSQSSQVAVKKSKIVLIIPCGKNVEKIAK